MIKKEKLFDEADKVGIEKLPESLKRSVLHIWEKTQHNTNWKLYKDDKDFKEMVDLTLLKLADIIPSQSEELLPDFSGILKEIYFMERLLALHDKVVYKNTLGIFIKELQEAITKKKIRKTSPVAKDILEMQEFVIGIYNKMKSAKHLLIPAEMIQKYKDYDVKYVNAISIKENAVDNNKADIIPLEGIPNAAKVMCSTDFAKMKFESIGFTGKWLKLIGDPCKGFTAMVFGKPKMGKSYLCVEFAGYLARKFGKVLYVAKEEKLDATLQKKLDDKDVAHENLFVTDSLPADLSAYDYVFLDSVTKLGLSPGDIDSLRKANPGKSFILIFQSTKEGNFRGENGYQHDVDVVIEVPQRGKAVQFGRFNQGGEINIFDQEAQSDIPQETDGLSGIKKKPVRKPDWTEPEYLTQSDHARLKQIKKYYQAGDLEMAMDIARSGDTEIREAIPGDIWEKMGGQLTKTGEEKLLKQQSTQKKTVKRIYLPYTFEVVELEKIFAYQMGEKIPDIDFCEILADAVEVNENLPHLIKELGKGFHQILPMLYKAAEKYQ